MLAAFPAGGGQAQTVPIGRGQNDLAFRADQRLGGVFDQIEKHLNKQVAIAVDGRQRWVIFLDEPDMAAERGLARPANHPNNFLTGGPPPPPPPITPPRPTTTRQLTPHSRPT